MLTTGSRLKKVRPSLCSVSGLPAWWGRFPLGVSFERAKETKTRLGRSPLRTPLGVRGWDCVKSRFGPSPLLWPLFVSPYQATMAAGPMAGCFPHPGLPWRSGVPAAGNSGTPGKGPGGRNTTYKEVGTPVESPIHLCDMNSSRAETRRTQGHPVPRGGFHKAGEDPAFGGLW